MKRIWSQLVVLAVAAFGLFTLGVCDSANAEILSNLSNSANRVGRFDGGSWNTTFTDVLGPLTSITVSEAENRIFVSDPENDTVHAYDRTTGAFEGDVTGGIFTNPLGVAIGPDGLLYVSDNNAGTIQRFNAGTLALVDEFMTGLPGSNYGIGFSSNGNFWAMERAGGAGGSLREFSSTGTLLNTFANFATEANDLAFSNVDGMGYAVHNPSGLFSGSGTVVRFDPSDPAGTATNLNLTGGSGGPAIISAMGVTIDTDGTLLVTEWCCGANQAVYRYNSSTGAFIEQVGANLGGGNHPLQLWAPGESPSAVPEPSTFALATMGLIGLGWFGYRRRR